MGSVRWKHWASQHPKMLATYLTSSGSFRSGSSHVLKRPWVQEISLFLPNWMEPLISFDGYKRISFFDNHFLSRKKRM